MPMKHSSSHEDQRTSSSMDSLPDLLLELPPVDSVTGVRRGRLDTVFPVLQADVSQSTKDWQSPTLLPSVVHQFTSVESLDLVLESELSLRKSDADSLRKIANPRTVHGGTPVLLSQLGSFASFLALRGSAGNCIINWLKEAEPELYDELDWISQVSSPPMSISRSDELILEGISARPLYSSPSRVVAMKQLIPTRFHALVLPLVAGKWDIALQAIVSDPSINDPTLMSSLVKFVLPVNNVLPQKLVSSSSGILKDIIHCVNQYLKGKNDYLDSKISPFLRIFFAINYCENPDFNIEHTLVSPLRLTVLIGLSDEEKLSDLILKNLKKNSQNPFPVVLFGLLLFPTLTHPLVSRCIVFVRELCNQLRGNAWLIRNLIDKIFAIPQVSCIMTCYYCGKALLLTPGDTRCPHRGCHRALPCCCICLEPVTASTVWCSTCRHGGHKEHVLKWFENFDDCPVAGCHCQCSSIDGS